MKWTLVGFILLFFVVPVHAQTPVFEPDDCPFPAPDRVSCGYLIVPEDRSVPDGEVVELAVAIVSAKGTPQPDPVVYLEGGPGGSALFSLTDWLDHPMGETRDIVLIDQRGTGFSFPSLNCYELEEDAEDDPVGVCRERLLSEGIDLNLYNSAQSAADINDLRAALGYDQVNLYGISYGTRLALTILRDYPEGVRSVVIDSVFPPEINEGEEGPTPFVNALDHLFVQCQADAACNAAYPDLQTTFYDLVDAYNQNPPVFAYDDGFEVYEIELFGDDVIGLVFESLYDANVVPMLPLGLTMLANPRDDIDLQEGLDIISGYWTVEDWQAGETSYEEGPFDSDQVLDYLDEFGDITDSEGMYFSVDCAEEFPFYGDFDGVYDLIETAPEALQIYFEIQVETVFVDCNAWAVAAAAPVEAERVNSNVPTLLVSGRYDPITPPSYADSALVGLSQGQHLVFEHGSHGTTLTFDCAREIVADFFDDPGASVDEGCLATQPAFYVE